MNIEEIQERRDNFNLRKRVKEMAGILVKRISNLVNKKEKIILEKNWRDG
jgi:hypothetical protein